MCVGRFIMSEEKVKKEEVTEEVAPIEEPKQETKKEPKKPKKKRKKLKITLIVLAVVLGIPLLIAGWLGFVPGLSALLGANKARDLGVTYTQADYLSYQEKAQATFLDFADAPPNPDRPDHKLVFADPVTVTNVVFTQEELTAAINETDWLWMPVKNAQVRLSDNTVEVSGNINIDYIDKFIGFIGGVGYSNDDVNQAVSWGKRLMGDPPVYIKADASVENDRLSFNLIEAQVGRYNVPQDIASKVLSTGSTNSIIRADNFEAKLAQPTDGGILFTGTIPSTTYIKHQ